MKNSYTMRNLAEDILKEAKTPLSSQEIWNAAVEKALDKKVSYSGATPAHLNLYNTLNGDIKNSEKSIFAKVSKNPALFILKEKQNATSPEIIEKKIEQIEKSEESKSNNESDYGEADLHIPLAIFVDQDDHFSCKVKTIRQQKATKRKVSKSSGKVKDIWTFPDLIGIYLPFRDYHEATTDFLKKSNNSPLKVFSFELKKVLNSSNLRESFFQAVSNSSWANEGYLAAEEISDDPEFMQEMRLLTNSFGIGVIQINKEAPKDSKLLIPARFRENLDIEVLDKLIRRCPEVREIVEIVGDSIDIGKIVDPNNLFDPIYDDEQYAELTADGFKGISGRKK